MLPRHRFSTVQAAARLWRQLLTATEASSRGTATLMHDSDIQAAVSNRNPSSSISSSSSCHISTTSSSRSVKSPVSHSESASSDGAGRGRSRRSTAGGWAGGDTKRGASWARATRLFKAEGTTKEMQPVQLTRAITQVSNLDDLEKLTQQHSGCLNHIHVAAAFSKACQLFSYRQELVPVSRVHALMGRLWQLLQPQQPHDRHSRELVNILWAASKVGFDHPPLIDACWSQLVAGVSKAEPRYLSVALYSAALLAGRGYQVNKQQAEQLVSALVQMQQQQADNPQVLSNTLWAAAKLGLQLPQQQLEQLLSALVEQRHAAKPQELSNALWAVATLGQQQPQQQQQQPYHQLPQQQLQQLSQQLLSALVEQRHAAKPQELSNALWASATLGLQQLPQQEMQQLVSAVVEQQQATKPQELANTLWAAATLQLQLPEEQGERLMAALMQRRQAAKPQELSMALWAAATSGLLLPEQQAQQLVAALLQQRQAAKPTEVSTALWAAATLGCALPSSTWQEAFAALKAMGQNLKPQELSSALVSAAKRHQDFSSEAMQRVLLQLVDGITQEQVSAMEPRIISYILWALSELNLCRQPLVSWLVVAAQQQVAAMTPHEVNNTGLAAARLGLQHAQLFAALADAAVQRVEDFNPQELCNLCWSLAAADQQQLSGVVVHLCQRVVDGSMWSGAVAEMQQLYQVHLCLQDWQRASGGPSVGLADALSAEQLQQCEQAWQEQMARHATQGKSAFQQQVFKCTQRLLGLTDCRQEARTEDGAFSVDVLATDAASGAQIALEADGPSHFLWPSMQPTGGTMARDRALAARGYVVVVVPFWEWAKVAGDPAREAVYLGRRVAAALSGVGRRGAAAMA